MVAASEDNTLSMPSMEQMAVEAVSHLASEGYSNQLMRLRRPLLNELARRLVTPGQKRSEVMSWLNEQLGPDDDPADEVGKDAFYRFAQRLGEAYRRVWGQHSSAVLTTELARDPNFNDEDLVEFNRRRLQQLIGQELIAAQTPDELDTKRVFAILSAIRSADQTGLDKAKLDLDRQKAEQRAEKLQADVTLLRQKIEGLPDKVAALRKRLDNLAQRTKRGESIPQRVFDEIRQELTELADTGEGEAA